MSALRLQCPAFVHRWLAPLSIISVVAVLYLQVRNHGFIEFDDPSYVAGNPWVLGGLSWSSFGWAWSTFDCANYHPVTWLSYLLDIRLFSVWPGGIALENALLHAINGCLVLWLFSALGCSRWGALLGALVFVVHPLDVESVAWISERKTVLAALFGLFATLHYVRRARAGRPPVDWLVIVSLALSLLSKPWFVVLPGVLLVLDCWPLGRLPVYRAALLLPENWGQWLQPLSGLLREKVLLFILIFASAGLTLASQHAGGALRAFEQVSPGLRLANATVSTCDYLADAVRLGSNGLFYEMSTSIPMGRILLAAAILLAATTTAVVFARRCPVLAAGWLWFLLFLLPVIGLVQVGWQARADRYMYLPLVGLLWILVVLGEHAFAHLRPALRPLVPAGAAACIAAAGFATYHQVGLWRNTFGIVGHSIAEIGATPRLVGLLGTAHLRVGRWQQALPLLVRSLQGDPKDQTIAINLAIALFLSGRQTEAVELAQKILDQLPDFYPAHRHLAHFYRDMGKPDLARKHEACMRQLHPESARFDIPADLSSPGGLEQ
jgi:tetratricopeptide (TPR) repeat protein